MEALQTFLENLYKDLTEQLNLYAEMGEVPIRKLSGALQVLRDTMITIKNYLAENPFTDESSEIDFFKHPKPRFVSHQFYLIDYTLIQMQRPALTDPALLAFYENELRTVLAFFHQYKFLYQYYLMDATDLDRQLFLRSAGPLDLLLPVVPDPDPAFTTNGDYLFARFIANERLRDFLIEEIDRLRAPNTSDTSAVKITWTGDAINLAELAYGLWLTGQLNNGNASVTQITTYLEKCFNATIGKPHRRWEAIAARKRISLTSFLDKMRDAIRKRWDDENGK